MPKHVSSQFIKLLRTQLRRMLLRKDNRMSNLRTERELHIAQAIQRRRHNKAECRLTKLATLGKHRPRTAMCSTEL